MITLRVLQPQATVARGPYENELWSGKTEAIPRPDDFICINQEDASYVVERVEFDYTTEPSTVSVWVVSHDKY